MMNIIRFLTVLCLHGILGWETLLASSHEGMEWNFVPGPSEILEGSAQTLVVLLASVVANANDN